MTPLRGFTPDAEPTTPGIMTACANVVPFEAGFKGAPSAVATTAAVLSAACTGAVVATKLDGSRRVIAGTGTKLYELSGTSWTDRTRTAVDYTSGSDVRWSFCQFGDTTLASNLVDAMQFSTSGAFANLTVAPKAKILLSASNAFVLAFNVVSPNTDLGTAPDGWQCCAQYDHTDWTPNVATSATTGRLIEVEGGIQAAAMLGEYPVVYKKRGIFLGQYVGAPEVWKFSVVPGGEAGAAGQDCVVDIGGAHFIVGDDSFWLFDGTRPIPVGEGIVRQWWLDNSNATYRYKTKVAYDKQNKLVRIFYPSNVSTECDSTLVFHIITKQWGKADRSIECYLNYIAPGVTIDGLDAFGATIDALPNIPVDSQFWVAGGQTPSYFDTNHRLVSLNGACGSASFTTGDVGDDDAVSMVDRVRCRFTASPSAASAAGFFKFNEGDSLAMGSVGAMNDGKFDLRQSGRFHRVRFDLTGDFKVTGYDIKLIEAGRR